MGGEQEAGGAPKLMVVAGTRPEAIKLAPVILELRRQDYPLVVCASGQHRELFDRAMAMFGLAADLDLALMQPNQSVDGFLARALPPLRVAMQLDRPDLVVVQGDTATAFAAALAAFYLRIPVAHVEAGLRSGDAANPFPEEQHRRQIAQVAALHFAPTGAAQMALLGEGVAAETIHLTGNSGIDALHLILARLDSDAALGAELAARFPFLSPRKPLVIVTLHRRENHGEPIARIAAALRELAGEAEIVVPLHPHPRAGAALKAALDGTPGIRLVAPLDYIEFVYLLRRARLVATDSGGVQEEAPVIGCPVLVLRQVTERIEGLATGNARLVGTDGGDFLREARELLGAPARHSAMAVPASPYGDGGATARIVAAIDDWWRGSPPPRKPAPIRHGSALAGAMPLSRRPNRR